MAQNATSSQTDQIAGSLWTNVVTTAERLQDQLSSPSAFYQAGAVAAALILGWLLARPARAGLLRRTASGEAAERFYERLGLLIPLAFGAALMWLVVPALAASGEPVSLIRVIASLLTAWVVIHLVSSLVSDPFWSRTFALFAWLAAALNILRLLEPSIAFLDGLKLPPGGENAVSVFDVIWAVALGIILLWAASFAAKIIQGRLNNSTKLTPSVRGLLGQLIQISLISGAIVFAMSAAKFDLTGLAVLTGAIGVGIGFGLQSIFSNFIAGIIILLEKTLKVGARGGR